MRHKNRNGNKPYTEEQREAAFWAKVDKSGECWLWTGALQRDGYAHFGRLGKTISAHRHVYEKHVGPIPDGLDLLHSCDVRHCVRPAHLRPGTHQENIAEMTVKGRAGARGEKCKHAKLTEAAVREIRSLRGIEPAKSIATRFGVNASHISNLWTRRVWKHLP